MNTRNLLTLMTFAGIVALVACSSDTTDDGAFSSSESFCTAKAEAECKTLGVKCSAADDACKSARVMACNAAATTSKGIGRAYRSGSAQACIDKINEVYKEGATITAASEAEAVKLCDRVFGGAKQERDPCANTFECAAELICDGVCAKEEIVALNGGCGNAGQKCDPATYCQLQGGKQFCVARNKLNDTCNEMSAPCIESLRCVSQCKEKVAVGQPCDKDADCAGALPYCDLKSSPRKCKPKYESTTQACHDYGSVL